ncbi:zinc ribbon domain-containing protein, partial [Curtobacterium luteum]
MIRCEHCGSALPDGAIFCGECGRAVTASANRLPAATAPVEQAPPPPLLQPDVHGRRPDPAADAWLPEATLDPATRAWLTGSDRTGEGAPTQAQYPDGPAQTDQSAHSAGPTPWTPSAGGSSADEPPLDPDAFAAEPTTGAADDDPEVTRVAERARRAAGTNPPTAPASSGASSTPTPPSAPAWEPHAQRDVPSWQPPARDAAPARPSTPSW